MNALLKEIKDIYTEGCVTILLNTHRTKPDNVRDPLTLKNLLKDAEERLYRDYDKRFVWPIMENLNKVVESIDYNHNLDSLAIFANQTFAEYVRLPISVTDRVVIDETFATRDIVRALHSEAAYYVLVVSRQQARLIEAYSGRVVAEDAGEFPLKNTIYTTDRAKLTTVKGQDNLIEEFFNQVDKALLETIKHHPLPVLLATETRNADHYLKIADKKDLIIGHINRNRDDEKAHHIIPDAWAVVQELIKKHTAARIAELHQAVNNGKFVSDYREIWDAVLQGRGKTLFVKRGFYQPALLADNEIVLVDQVDKNQKGVVDDIIDEIIENHVQFGGDVVFMEGNELDEFQNLALVTRY
ncbi:AOC03_06830 family ribosome hibernation factor [Parapedobacter tibetensis]|uniref:AOC03_06830 family ribosome hibernation factor n=1 Tax=Parapedobacter tibetensis TaxID=2972951 RepID=UPI00214DC91C|nr:hypothetical protein [Parapedobacter tibetensis]